MRTPIKVTVGRAHYWANLDWETIPANEDHKARFRELQDAVGRRGLRCIRPCPGYDMLSLGYAGPPEGGGRAPAYPALAGAVADARKQPWIGVFCLDAKVDRWWMVAITEGQSIIPGGDIVGTRTEVEAARKGISGLKDWAFYDGDITDLQGYLTDARAASGKPAMAHVFVWRPSIWHLVGVAAVIAAVIGWTAWQRHEATVAQRAVLAAARLRLEALRERLTLAQARAAARRPWHDETRPAAFTTACLGFVARIPIDLWGWSPQSVRCGPTGTVILTWHRGIGATTARAPRGALQAGGDTIRRVWPAAFPVAHPHRAARPLPPAARLERDLYAWAQAWPVALTLTATAQTPVLPGVGAAPAHPHAGASLYAPRSAQVTTTHPDALLRLDRLPSVRITHLSVSDPLGASPVWTARVRYWVTTHTAP
jgi:hypothetical protein